MDDGPWCVLSGGPAVEHNVDLPARQQARGALNEHAVLRRIEDPER
jgi:hypothetical protein